MTPFRCLSCGREIGQTDGRVLMIGGVEFRRAVTPTCPCGRPRGWHPVQAYSERWAEEARKNQSGKS